jgi:hypothetical protein
MYPVTTSGWLVICPTCSDEQMAKSLREASNLFDFHECSDNPRKVSDYTLVEANDPVELVKPMFSTNPIG